MDLLGAALYTCGFYVVAACLVALVSLPLVGMRRLTRALPGAEQLAYALTLAILHALHIGSSRHSR